jgi:tRNA(Ile)-lysidine synthetase-like protein
MFGKTTYIVAVSGGVDSVALLHMLASRKPDDVMYIVAHFDHGIRKYSAEDALFVQELARQYGMECVVGHGELGEDASEATARDARYAFLRSAATMYKAEKIITAHHQDDFLETIILNLLRTQSYRALLPMQGQQDILRPLLGKTKSELITYAKEHRLSWRDDLSNDDLSYTRNYVRHVLLPKIDIKRTDFLRLSRKMEDLLHEIDSRISTMLPRMNSLSRGGFVVLPWCVQKELMHVWCVKNGIQVDKKQIEAAALAVKTLPIGKRMSLGKGLWLVSEQKNVLITSENA